MYSLIGTNEIVCILVGSSALTIVLYNIREIAVIIIVDSSTINPFTRFASLLVPFYYIICDPTSPLSSNDSSAVLNAPLLSNPTP